MIGVQAAHWGLALVPVFVMLGLFIWLDAFKLMNLKEVILLLFLGGLGALAAYPLSGIFIDRLPIGFSNYSRFAAPWIEEAVKGLIVVGLFRLNRIGFKLDAVISGFAIGAGFSVVENIIYLTRFPEYGAGTWLVRGLGTAVMHGTTLAILAASAHEFAERENRAAAGEFNFNLLWFVPGYFAAVAIHMAFNQFPDQPMVAMMGAAILAPLALMGIFHFGTAEAERWLSADRAAHQAERDALAAGGWPDSPATARVQALAERIGADDVRRYWQLRATLVVEAEESMIEEAAGDVEIDKAGVRAAFAELAELERKLGRGSLSALKAALPFSRNDAWEVSELRQRVGRR